MKKYLCLAISAVMCVYSCKPKPQQTSGSNTSGVAFEAKNNHSSRTANVLFSVEQTENQQQALGEKLVSSYKCWYFNELPKPAYDSYAKDTIKFQTQVLATSQKLTSYMVTSNEIRKRMRANADGTAVALEALEKGSFVLNFMPNMYSGFTKLKLAYKILIVGGTLPSFTLDSIKQVFVAKNGKERLASSGIVGYDKVDAQDATNGPLPEDNLLVQQAIIAAIKEVEANTKIDKNDAAEFKPLACEDAKILFAQAKE